MTYSLYLPAENPGKTVRNLAANANNTGKNVSLLALSGTILPIPKQIRTHQQFFYGVSTRIITHCTVVSRLLQFYCLLNYIIPEFFLSWGHILICICINST